MHGEGVRREQDILQEHLQQIYKSTCVSQSDTIESVIEKLTRRVELLGCHRTRLQLIYEARQAQLSQLKVRLAEEELQYKNLRNLLDNIRYNKQDTVASERLRQEERQRCLNKQILEQKNRLESGYDARQRKLQVFLETEANLRKQIDEQQLQNIQCVGSTLVKHHTKSMEEAMEKRATLEQIFRGEVLDLCKVLGITGQVQRQVAVNTELTGLSVSQLRFRDSLRAQNKQLQQKRETVLAQPHNPLNVASVGERDTTAEENSASSQSLGNGARVRTAASTIYNPRHELLYNSVRGESDGPYNIQGAEKQHRTFIDRLYESADASCQAKIAVRRVPITNLCVDGGGNVLETERTQVEIAEALGRMQATRRAVKGQDEPFVRAMVRSTPPRDSGIPRPVEIDLRRHKPRDEKRKYRTVNVYKLNMQTAVRPRPAFRQRLVREEHDELFLDIPGERGASEALKGKIYEYNRLKAMYETYLRIGNTHVCNRLQVQMKRRLRQIDQLNTSIKRGCQ